MITAAYVDRVNLAQMPAAVIILLVSYTFLSQVSVKRQHIYIIIASTSSNYAGAQAHSTNESRFIDTLSVHAIIKAARIIYYSRV